MSTEEPSIELRILRMVRQTLVDVAKDTHTTPGLKHPLSQNTMHNIRDCLDLITAREAELTGVDLKANKARPHFADEPQDAVVVTLDTKKKD